MKTQEDYILMIDYFKQHYPKIYQEGLRAIEYKYGISSRQSDDME